MRLPIPIFTENKVYTGVEITRPRASVIADTKTAVDDGQIFGAIKRFLSGCIKSLLTEDEEEIDDKAEIKRALSLMPFRSAEHLVLQVMLLVDPDNDGVEGIYECPRCGKKIVAELIKDDTIDLDTRDFISMLPVNYMDEDEPTITISLQDPVNLINKNTKEVLDSVESFTLRHPNLNDCMVAERIHGTRDAVRMQFAMYIEAITEINGNPVDKKYKNTFGMLIFENIKNVREDLGSLNQSVAKYGVNPDVDKNCNGCGKVFSVPISTSSFFVSGLAL